MKTQEQSSISQVKPKLEIPKTELVGVKKTKRSHTRISKITSTHRLENINFTF